jgi:hypothetical protein
MRVVSRPDRTPLPRAPGSIPRRGYGFASRNQAPRAAHLIGWLAQNSPGSNFIGTLPLAARPVHDLYLIAGPDGEYLHISPNGNMYVFGAIQPNVVKLDAIAYQTSS